MFDSLQDDGGQTSGGIVGWWLRLTAPPGAQCYDQASTIVEREYLRRSQLTSWAALFGFFTPLLLLQQAGDPGTLIGIIIFVFVSVLVLVLNRSGRQTLAALLLVLSLDAVLEGALVTAQGGLSSGWLLTFDLFVLPLIAVGVLLNRHFIWGFMLLHIFLILGDFYLLPHQQDLDLLVQKWNGPAVAFARPLIIQIAGCLLGFLEVRSTDLAIIRADRAQFMGKLQRATIKQKEELDEGIREILSILTRFANGDFTAPISLPRENMLWRVASSINIFLARLQNARRAEKLLRQVEQEVTQLVAALESELRGLPAQWPHPSGGPLDPLIRQLQVLVQESEDAS